MCFFGVCVSVCVFSRDLSICKHVALSSEAWLAQNGFSVNADCRRANWSQRSGCSKEQNIGLGGRVQGENGERQHQIKFPGIDEARIHAYVPPSLPP